MGMLYVSQKSLNSKKKKIKPYAAPKRPPAYMQGVLKVEQPFRRESNADKVPSKTSTGYLCAARKEDKVYTGNNMIGISTMHKSNLVPLFSTEEAIDNARMRRG